MGRVQPGQPCSQPAAFFPYRIDATLTADVVEMIEQDGRQRRRLPITGPLVGPGVAALLARRAVFLEHVQQRWQVGACAAPRIRD